MQWWPGDKGEIDRQIKEIRSRMELGMRSDDGLRPNYNPHDADVLYTFEFFRDRLIPLDDTNRLFTCAAFDKKTGRCTQYEARPSLCKKFICGPASAGQVPSMGFMTSEKLDRENNL